MTRNTPHDDPDSNVSVADNATYVSDITDTHVVEAFTRDEMAEQLRRQLRSEMQRELHANVVTAQVIEPDPPPFWTKRRIVMLVSLILIVMTGIAVGVVLVIRANAPDEEEFLEGTTINGNISDDRFGEDVVLSRDGSTMASVANEGHYVRVFKRDLEAVWNPLGQTLTFEYEQDGKFPGRLDMNKDGSVLAVGRWNNDDAGTNAGYAVIYWYDEGTDMWTPVGDPLEGRAPRDHYVSGIICILTLNHFPVLTLSNHSLS